MSKTQKDPIVCLQLQWQSPQSSRQKSSAIIHSTFIYYWTLPIPSVTTEINKVTAAGRDIATFFPYSRGDRFLKTKFDQAIYKRWRDVSSTSNFNSEHRDSLSIRTTVRYKVRVATCLWKSSLLQEQLIQ